MQAIDVPLRMNVYFVCVCTVYVYNHQIFATIFDCVSIHLVCLCVCACGAAHYVQPVNGHIVDRFEYIFQLLLLWSVRQQCPFSKQ